MRGSPFVHAVGDADRPEGVDAVGGEREEGTDPVGAPVVRLVDRRGEPGLAQGDGGDGTGDPAAGHDGCLHGCSLGRVIVI